MTKHTTSSRRLPRPAKEDQPILAPALPRNLVVEAVSYQITSQGIVVPQSGGAIMPEGFLTETGLRWS